MVRDIQRAVAEHYGIPLETMSQSGIGSKLREISHPRQMAMLLSRRMTRKSYPLIGDLFDRDHSTVISGIRCARRRCLADRRHLQALCEIRARVLHSCAPYVLNSFNAGSKA